MEFKRRLEVLKEDGGHEEDGGQKEDEGYKGG